MACDGAEVNPDIAAIEFFDDELLVLVLRSIGNPHRAFLALVNYSTSSLTYNDLPLTLLDQPFDSVACAAASALASVPMEIVRSRELAITASLRRMEVACNGIAGRRVACVLDAEAEEMECVDLDGDEGEEMEEDSMVMRDSEE